MKITWDVIVESSLIGQPGYIMAWGTWLHQWLGEPSYIMAWGTWLYLGLGNLATSWLGELGYILAWGSWLHRRQCGIVHQQSPVLSEPPA